MPENRKRVLQKAAAILLLLPALLLSGCFGPGRENIPYEPDTPAPAAHDGRFVSDHGSMVFNGDGSSVELDFDETLAALTGLPEGAQAGSYVFLSGDLPPHGSLPVRYDVAHELELTLGERSVVIDMGLAAEDGSAGRVGVDVVTPERIPMLFRGNGGFFSVIFQKE